MTLTVRLFGLELLHIEASTEDQGDEAGYDHDVASTAIDAEPSGALGFTSPAVEVDE